LGLRFLTAARIPILLLLPALLAAQEPAPSSPPSRSAVPVGGLVEGIATEADPSQTYTLYLPSAYSAERTWPALLIFDPRGRGTRAAEIFRPGAERFGWILVSSDNTASDGAMEPNLRAVNALMPELARRWAADPRRVYAAGMSGTAVVAWVVARQTGALAGVVAAAAPHQPQVFEGVTEIGFAHFGTVGDGDFNFHEMRRMDRFLGELGAPHRLEVFAGEHGWMPPELATAALGWMEVQAMRQGRRPADADLVRELFADELERARAREERGEPLEALSSYRALADGSAGLAPVAEQLAAVRRKVGELTGHPQVAREEKELARLETEEVRNRRRLGEVTRDLRQAASQGAAAESPPTAEQLVARLEIRRLLERSAGEGRDARAARRMLATISSQTSFYLRRLFWSQRAWREAATVLEVAVTIQPERPELWYDLACARALDGHKKPALEALETAVEKGFSDVEHLEGDPDLEALREMDGYRALVEALTIGRSEGEGGNAGSPPDDGDEDSGATAVVG